jgi:rubredoxin
MQTTAISVRCKTPGCGTTLSLGIIRTDPVVWISAYGPRKEVCPVCRIEHEYFRENLTSSSLEQ